MKKISYRQYGGVEVLNMVDEEIPAITNDTILIKIKAVAINPLDWKIREGSMKLMTGSKFPKGIGIDFSGIIEQAGSAVKSFKKGDAVFGALDTFKGGAMAEYVVAAEKDITLKPANISFEQAAALPVAGSAALQIFDKLVNIKPGDEVLINGAAGGIGTFAIQMAKMKRSTVTSVAGSDAVLPGSDLTVNYRKEDIRRSGKKYDVIIDLSGKLPFNEAKVILKPVSVYVNTIPGPKQILASFFHNLFSRKKYKVLLLKISQAYLKTLAQYAAEDLQIVIGRTYAMTDFAKAYSEVPLGGFPGKAIITL